MLIPDTAVSCTSHEGSQVREKFSFKVSDSDFGTSSYSNPGGIISTCVAVARKPQGVAVRNSNDPTANTVFFTHDEWKAFVSGTKAGEFDVA